MLPYKYVRLLGTRLGAADRLGTRLTTLNMSGTSLRTTYTPSYARTASKSETYQKYNQMTISCSRYSEIPGYPSKYVTLSDSLFPNRFLATVANHDTVASPNSTTVNVPPQLNALFQWYEDVIGLTEVREAQNKVIEAENDFVRIQSDRQHQQSLLNQLQTELRSLSAELDRLNRGDPIFLETITKQHTLFRKEAAVLEKYQSLQEDERIKFGLLSAAVRESHEKERQRTERTKYWSIIGSIIGALVGMTGAGINSFLRNRRIKELDLTIKSQHQEVQTVLNDVRTRIHSEDDPAVSVTTNGVSNKDLRIELDNIKQLIVEKGGDIEGVDNLVTDLEYRIKINSLATVAFVYGAFALTIPILYAIFTKGT